MENNYAPPSSNVGDSGSVTGQITSQSLEMLRGTKPWILLIGIVAILLSALAFFAVVGGVMQRSGGLGLGGLPRVYQGIFILTLVFGGLSLFLGILMIRYSISIGRFLRSNNLDDMEKSIKIGRSFWRTAGITTILGIAAYGFMVSTMVNRW